MTYLILHLSDIHISGNTDSILSRGELIARSTFSSLKDVDHVFFIVSGDIAFSGTKEQYALAETFLSEISNAILKERRDIGLSFIICPGNHDCDFSGTQTIRNAIVEKVKSEDIDAVDEQVIEVCTDVQRNFFDFRNSLESEYQSDDKLWRKHIFEFCGKKIQINSLNVAWLSELHESQGSLAFPVTRYESDTDENDLVITVMHHPLNWFSQSTYRRFRSLIRKNSDLIITGHEHIGNVGTIDEAENNKSSFIEGCALQENGSPNSSFNVIKLNTEKEEFCLVRYEWNNELYMPGEKGSWSAWHPLPISNNKPFNISRDFQKFLDDPGAFIKHPFTTSVTLSDIYTSPDLKNVNESTNSKKEIISSNNIIENIKDGNYFIIEGEEKSGRTSLLKQYYLRLHEMGLIPVYIEAKNIHKSSNDEIDKIIYRAVEEQYGDVEKYKQHSKSLKILLIDDFDQISFKNENSQIKVITQLKEQFSKILITVSDMFEIRDFLEASSVSALGGMSRYILQPFGYQRRADFIKKWFTLGQVGTLSKAEFLAQCDKAERLLGAVMSKMIIPSSPLYLITLLQSINSEIYSDFQHGSLAEYYRFLLTNAFQQVGVNKDKLSASIDYAAHLAWAYHNSNASELSKLDLQNFNKVFSDKWYTVDFEKKLEELLKARVLIKSGDGYSFHYPYIYYYLKGLYISHNLSNTEMREYIKHCCDHLYVRDYANTILFVAHHSSENFIINSIIEAYEKLFSDQEPIHFNSDTEKVNRIIKDAPELPFHDVSPEEYRERQNRVKDELSDDNDGLIDKEEDSEDLSMVAQLTMLLKSGEILGQVLKNQYSKIQREDKEKYIAQLFNGPLRAISEFYDVFSKSPELLIAELEKEISKQNKNLYGEALSKFAKKITMQLIQVVSAGFIFKAAQSASAENLLENVHEAVKANNTIAFRLIELAILLDSPKRIPKEKLRFILKDIDGDLITNRIVKILVMNRLYMFKTTESDMQWLNESSLDIPLPTQHSISYSQHKQRVTK